MTRRSLLNPVLHAAVYAAFIYLLSSLPDPPVLGPMPLNDKIKHFALYATFAILVARAAIAYARSALAVAALTIVLVSAYGATDEFHQRFTPGRSCDVNDWLADTAAACAVAVFVPAYLSCRRRESFR